MWALRISRGVLKSVSASSSGARNTTDHKTEVQIQLPPAVGTAAKLLYIAQSHKRTFRGVSERDYNPLYSYSDKFSDHFLSFLGDVSEAGICLHPQAKSLVSWDQSIELVPDFEDGD
jgi:hypothetical protein